MKCRFMILMLLLAVAPIAMGQTREGFTPVGADSTLVAAAQAAAVSVPKTDWLAPFTKVSVDGPMTIRFKRVTSPEELKIVYDTKGNLASRFRATIDKNGVLNITERFDTKLTTAQTEVTLYFMNLDFIKVSHATAKFEDTIKGNILDVSVSGGAVLTLPIETLDASVECTGKSALILSGRSRYFKIEVSTAKVDAFALETVALNVNASHGAELKMTVTERLEAVTSTSAKLFYKGHPRIIRNRNSLFGGDIVAVD